ncbi:DNA topoisomerase VI, B subunit, variant [Aphanomyces astaci]|uniref:DNA topoisomerase VI, B subunit, variant n=1 Tax=Aphanomyces astaci TaxID=112090 RepID=W4GTD4_APHAT|nr:DNA topoisomerase VI, B subunit, variant [Aphanomyces astaci]ETV82551.1 DNA topoisomerase VI, B subunit, variant [Aphanomyces astaci]|eukprot:XP_009828220.1 DNA topoisomerase VI, B subunit, variant [Aphanomyces astaci]
MSTQSVKVNARGEVLQIRSPAEFFAENQNIAGFDNPGKCLYTTIRELVENSLDAAESIGVLPQIDVTITEMDEAAFNTSRDIQVTTRFDKDLYSDPKEKKRKQPPSAVVNEMKQAESDEYDDDAPLKPKKKLKYDEDAPLKPRKTVKSAGTSPTTPSTATVAAPSPKQNAAPVNRNAIMYYKIEVKDNGCGMAHAQIPNMLGRVLAGSKYGVRQTRGKFGLGAKMARTCALIWSKKSTGMPITVRSAHMSKANTMPKHVSFCKLDIDIFKNEPNVLEHYKSRNIEEMTGTELTVTVGGNWTTYRSRIVHYFQQLAIITPYAQLELSFIKGKHKEFTMRYDRRSDQMPPTAQQVQHHPLALNDLLLAQLMEHSKQRTLHGFLCHDLAAVDANLATRIVNELDTPFTLDMDIHTLTSNHIHQVVRLLKEMHFNVPDGHWLSPAGEYNLRLGILKELEPDMVATHTYKTSEFEGHALIVEAAVSVGGAPMKEGISIYRFANRIPLLFEAGGDVVTRTANKDINWTYYKMDPKRDKIGVFVSIVSTKIPFKGTGKEYIGDDIPAIKDAVKQCLRQCCSQLRVKLVQRHLKHDKQERKQKLRRYIPDVTRALFGVLERMNSHPSPSTSTTAATLTQSQREFLEAKAELQASIRGKTLSAAILAEKLLVVVKRCDDQVALDYVAKPSEKTKSCVFAASVPLNARSTLLDPPIAHPVATFQLFSVVMMAAATPV